MVVEGGGTSAHAAHFGVGAPFWTMEETLVTVYRMMIGDFERDWFGSTFTLLLFLGWRLSFWVAAGLPVAFLTAMVLLLGFGGSLNAHHVQLIYAEAIGARYLKLSMITHREIEAEVLVSPLGPNRFDSTGFHCIMVKKTIM